MNPKSNASARVAQALSLIHICHKNPRLHSDETLIALSISSVTNPLAAERCV